MKNGYERGHRASIGLLLAGALIAATAAAASAQDDGAESTAAADAPFKIVAGEAVGPPDVDTGTIRIEDDITYTDGFVVRIDIDFDDDRLDGEIKMTMNFMEGDVAGGTAAYVPATYRIQNEGGVWAGQGIQFWADTEDHERGPFSMETYTLHGQGGYEGMTVHLFANFLEDGPPQPHGILFEAAPSTMPEPVEPF